MELDEILDCYFDYLVNVMILSLSSADRYECTDFELLRTEMMLNIKRMFSSRENYTKIIEMLKEEEKRKK